jgi:zinc protease
MKIFLLLLSAFLIGFSSSAASKPGAIKDAQIEFDTAGITSYKLDNGFKVILIPFASASNARVELMVKTGSKLEGYGETGMAHLLEHMLFKSAGHRKNIKDDLTRLGASYNGSTTSERTNFFETVNAEAEKIDELIKLEADRFLHANFTAADLASEMTVVRNELENSEHSPTGVVIEALNRNLFSWHGYGRSVIGARSDIEAASYETLSAFHRKHYRPDNAVLIVSGNFNPDRVLALAIRLFKQAKNPKASRPVNLTFEDPQIRSSTTELYLNQGVTIAASAWRLPSVKNREIHALDLAAAALCEPDWGSLRKDLVIDNKLAVSSSCFVAPGADYSRFIATARAGQAADPALIQQAMNQHIAKFVQNGITADQLERARLIDKNILATALNSHEEIADLVSDAEVNGDWRLFLWANDVVDSITLEEANQALKKWLVPTNQTNALLRHSDSIMPLEFPRPEQPGQLLKGKQWPAIISKADPPPTSFTELAQLTQTFTLEPQKAQAALISRRTQGDKVWLLLDNDYGNPAQLANRKQACMAASSLIKYGGAQYNRDALSAKMDQLQANWQINLDGIYLDVPRKNLQEAFSILFSVWSAPELPVSEFERYKTATIASYEASLKDSIKLATNQLRSRFDNYPVGHWRKPESFEQSIENIKQLSYEQVKRCSDDFIGISHARLGVVGQLTQADIQALWNSTAARSQARTNYQRIEIPNAPKASDTSPIVVVKPNTPNARVIGFTMIPMNVNSADYPALQLAVYAIGGHSSSLVWKRLRETEGLAYDSGMDINASVFEDRTTIEIYATSSSANAEKALNSLKSIVNQVLKDGLTAAEIEQSKTIWKQKRKAFLGDESQFVSSITNGLYDGTDFEFFVKMDEKIAKVDNQQATNAFRKYIQPNTLIWVVGK